MDMVMEGANREFVVSTDDEVEPGNYAYYDDLGFVVQNGVIVAYTEESPNFDEFGDKYYIVTETPDSPGKVKMVECTLRDDSTGEPISDKEPIEADWWEIGLV